MTLNCQLLCDTSPIYIEHLPFYNFQMSTSVKERKQQANNFVNIIVSTQWGVIFVRVDQDLDWMPPNGNALVISFKSFSIFKIFEFPI